VSAAENIGRLLVARGLLDEEGLGHVLHGVSEAGFFERVLESGAASEPELTRLVGEHLGIPGVDLSRTAVDLAALELVPRPVAEADVLLPLSTDGGRLHVAVNVAAVAQSTLDELQFITGMLVSPYAALPSTLERAVAAAYDARERGESLWHGEGISRDAPASIAALLPEETGIRTDEISTPTQEIEAISFEVGAAQEPAAGEEVMHSEKLAVGPSRVLVVDDEPEILRLIEKALRAEGLVVETARDGREAERKLQGEPPDLVLLDAMLPHLHGFELCSRIKGSPALRNVPVVLMSAVYRGWRFAQDAREAFGADDYVEKPFHLTDLVRRVRELLEQPPRAVARNEESERAYQEGLRLLGEGNAAAARTALEEAAQADPFSARNHFALGRALRDLGDAFRAMSAYEKAVELRPTHFAALCSLAEIYVEKGFRRKAVETLERALQAAPDGSTRENIRTRLLRLL
jgi:DNA-binding response OmpR family regulator